MLRYLADIFDKNKLCYVITAQCVGGRPGKLSAKKGQIAARAGNCAIPNYYYPMRGNSAQITAQGVIELEFVKLRFSVYNLLPLILTLMHEPYNLSR